MNKLVDFESSVYMPFRNVDSAHFIDVYMREGGYAPLFNARAGEELAQVRFVTRFGQSLESYWKRMALPPSRPRSLIANLATIEPGMFSTRRLVIRNPHGLIEGILLAARASKADSAIIVVPFDDSKLLQTLERALAEAKQEKLWGKEASWFCHLKIVVLPGHALYGKDDFLLAALHGMRPAFPNRMEFLFGEPVHIHRAEEFYAFSWIERFGGEEFARKGSNTTPGVYLLNVGGGTPKSVVVEVPGGTNIEKVMSLSGLDHKVSHGHLRWGGVLGRWYNYEQVKEWPFELVSSKLRLDVYQYPCLEWFDDENMILAKYATTNFVSKQSCGACLSCIYADTGIRKWSTEEKRSFSTLAKCSFLPLAIKSVGETSW